MSRTVIKYLCDRCSQDATACVVCDKGSRFIEARRGPDTDYTRYARKDVELTQQVISKMRVSFEIKNVIFNDPATIVMWADGTKTIVKCQPGDIYSPELGLAMAISKKALGNKGNYNEVFKQWLPEEKEYKVNALSLKNPEEFVFNVPLKPGSLNIDLLKDLSGTKTVTFEAKLVKE